MDIKHRNHTEKKEDDQEIDGGGWKEVKGNEKRINMCYLCILTSY